MSTKAQVGTSSQAALAIVAGAATLAAVILSWKIRKRHESDLACGIQDDSMVEEELLDIEMSFYQQGEPSISALTWFHGDYQQARPILESRLQAILHKNPWLCGRVMKRNNKLLLIYSHNALGIHQEDFFETVSPEASPICRTTTSIYELAEKTKDLILANSIGSAAPLLKISLVPCQSRPTDRFALIVSISHLIADGHTFYQIQSMLCSDNRDIVSLNAKRIKSTAQQQVAAMGGKQENYDFFAKPSVGFKLNLARGGLLRKTGLGPSNQVAMALVDTKQTQTTKEEAAKKGGVPFVSTNDVLTSWFLQNTKCSFGFMTLNWRERLKGHSSLHSGNYENVIFYRPEDSALPSLIRKSLSIFERTVTKDKSLPGLCQTTASTMALVTNWTTFAEPNEIQGCREDLHMPLYDATDVVSTTMALLIIFRSGPRGIGLYMVGTPEKLQGLKSAPFISTVNDTWTE